MSDAELNYGQVKLGQEEKGSGSDLPQIARTV